MTDPASPTPPATPAPVDPALRALRRLTTDDDLACVDDLCLPAGARDLVEMGATDAAVPVHAADPHR